MTKEFLPLGTVVTLKDGVKRLMITGRLQKESITKQVFDYCAVLWPEGMLDSSRMYLFNEEDVDKLYHIGLQDHEEFQFRYVLDEQRVQLQSPLKN